MRWLAADDPDWADAAATGTPATITSAKTAAARGHKRCCFIPYPLRKTWHDRRLRSTTAFLGRYLTRSDRDCKRRGIHPHVRLFVLRRGCRRVLALAQLDPADLAGQRLRQVVDELDAPRIRVLGKARAHEVGDLLRELVARLVTGGEHDERLDDLT